jgi:uncharacterized protein
MNEVEIVETKPVELKKPLVLLGFVGPGMVGGIAASHIIDQYKMEIIAHVHSTYLPPAVVFIDGVLRHPFRIYSDKKGAFCVIVCEMPLSAHGSYHIASTLLDWIEGKGVQELVVLEGIPIQGIPRNRQTFCAAEPEKIKECENKGIQMISSGLIQGIAGSVLNECLSRNITGIAFLTPAITFVPDPEGAAILIETVKNMYNLDITTQPLLDDAEKIRQKLNEIAEHHQRMRQVEERGGTHSLYT